MTNKIGFRVDANEEIAMGHLIRCISIAKQLQILQQEIIFIISEDYAKDFIINHGFICICLSNSYKQKDKEMEKIIDIIEKEVIDKMIIDSYEITYRYLSMIHKQVKTIYIDDINSFRYPVDLIVHYRYQASINEYIERNYEGVKFLLGSKYVPLRQEFSQESINIKKEVETIFITTGGTDPYNTIIQILDAIESCELKYLKKVIVTGRFYNYMEKLKQYAQRDCSIVIYNNIDNICEVMHQCDIAISAGGTTLAELCACGLPTICFSIADNQLKGTKAYSDDGLMMYVGDIRKKEDQVIDKIIDKLRLLVNDYSLRKEISYRVKNIIDGNGAKRIANEIIKL